jgi:lipid-binding SYLF domain-containing protein
MRGLTKFALAALATVTLVGGVTAQNNRGQNDEDEIASASGVAERREEILEMSKNAIADLRKDPSARELVDDAYGHAVFDTTKGGFLVTGAGGTGVAMRSNGSNPVYMHMGSGGVGLGAGLENYKFIVLFENADVYKRFIDGEWSAGATAQAAAGSDGAAVVGKFVNGVAVYHITDKGLIAQADVSGVRFWPSDRLNPGVG